MRQNQFDFFFFFLSFTVCLCKGCLILSSSFLILNVRVVMSASEAHHASLSRVFAGGLSNGDLSF